MNSTDPFAPWTPPPTREQLIAQARAHGARVSFKTLPGGTGYYGEAGALITDADATETAAWDQLLERMALTRPGQLLLTSSEFGKCGLSNGSFVGMRFEIRRIGRPFVVFSLNRLYRYGSEPQDVFQHREGEFATLSDATAFIEPSLIPYQDAAADDRAAALAHARATEY